MHLFLKFIFAIKLYMFRTVPLSIIRSFSLYTQQWYIAYRFADSLLASYQQTCMRYTIAVCTVYSCLVGFIIRSKGQYMSRMMIILCQWDFNEQIVKLVRLLLYTSEDCSRKFHAWVHFVPSQ